MARRRRIADWLKPLTPDTHQMPTDGSFGPAEVMGYEYLLAAMRSGAPGSWAENQQELARHFVSSVYLAVDTIASQASYADSKVFEELPWNQGSPPLPADEPVCQLLNNPNPEDTRGELLYAAAQQMALCSVALLWTPKFSGLDVPSEMYVLPSATALPLPPSPQMPNGAYRVMPIWPFGPWSTYPSFAYSAGALIPAEQVVRIKNGQHPVLRYSGVSAQSAMSTQIDVLDNIDRARLTTMQKGVDPTVAVEFDEAVMQPDRFDLQRLRAFYESQFSGPMGSKIWFNSPGAKMTPLSTSPKDMAWQEGHSAMTEMILAAFRVPKVVACLHESTSDTVLLAALRQFYELGLNPLLARIADKITQKIIKPYFGQELAWSLKGRAVHDEQLKESQLHLDTQVTGGCTIDEYRAERGRPPVGGDLGNQWVNRASTLVYEGVHSPKSGATAKSMNPERIATLLERAKTNGTALPLNGKVA